MQVTLCYHWDMQINMCTVINYHVLQLMWKEFRVLFIIKYLFYLIIFSSCFNMHSWEKKEVRIMDYIWDLNNFENLCIFYGLFIYSCVVCVKISENGFGLNQWDYPKILEILCRLIFYPWFSAHIVINTCMKEHFKFDNINLSIKHFFLNNGNICM